MSSKANQAHIALTEQMSCFVQLQAHVTLREPTSSIDLQGSSLSSCLTPPSLNPHYKPTFESLTMCQVLSGGRQRQIISSAARVARARGRGISSLFQQHCVCILTTSRRRGIQPTIAADQAHSTVQSLLLFSFKQLF